jgi:hypothetical protein
MFLKICNSYASLALHYRFHIQYMRDHRPVPLLRRAAGNKKAPAQGAEVWLAALRPQLCVL